MSPRPEFFLKQTRGPMIVKAKSWRNNQQKLVNIIYTEILEVLCTIIKVLRTKTLTTEKTGVLMRKYGGGGLAPVYLLGEGEL